MSFKALSFSISDGWKRWTVCGSFDRVQSDMKQDSGTGFQFSERYTQEANKAFACSEVTATSRRPMITAATTPTIVKSAVRKLDYRRRRCPSSTLMSPLPFPQGIYVNLAVSVYVFAG